MVLDIELTLNRFHFKRIASNKVQFACFRIAVWNNVPKHALCFEINWRTKEEEKREENGQEESGPNCPLCGKSLEFPWKYAVCKGEGGCEYVSMAATVSGLLRKVKDSGERATDRQDWCD